MHVPIIRQKGGLGNQIYSLLAAQFIYENLKKKVYIDNTSSFLADKIYRRKSHFDNKDLIMNSFLNPLMAILIRFFHNLSNRFPVFLYFLNNKNYKSMNFEINYLPTDKCLNKAGIFYIDGYFQNNIELIRISRRFFQTLYKSILSKCSDKKLISLNKTSIENTAFIHIRDYSLVSVPTDNLNLEYYINGINYLNNKKINKFVLISSKKSYLTKIVGDYLKERNINFISRINENVYDDFILMANAKFLIIANSSLSSAAALLSYKLNEREEDKSIVIYPNLKIEGEFSYWDPSFMRLDGWKGIK